MAILGHLYLYTLWAFTAYLRKVQNGKNTFFNQLEVGKSPLGKKIC